MRGDGLTGQLQDEVELERVEVLLVRRADAPRQAEEARLVEERARLGVVLEIEEVAAKGLHARGDRLEGLAQALQPARQDEVPRDVDAAGEHAPRTRAVGHHVRVGARAVRAERHGLADVLALGLVLADVIGVGRVVPQALDQLAQRGARFGAEQAALVVALALHVRRHVEAARRLQHPHEHRNECRGEAGREEAGSLHPPPRRERLVEGPALPL